MAIHNDLGRKGEDVAVAYLIQKGHTIIERNFRYQKAEVDIISLIGNTLVFTEVKARSTAVFGYPELAITDKKRELLRSAMEFYLIENKINEEGRFDYISIVINGDAYQVHHIEDAFFH